MAETVNPVEMEKIRMYKAGNNNNKRGDTLQKKVPMKILILFIVLIISCLEIRIGAGLLLYEASADQSTWLQLAQQFEPSPKHFELAKEQPLGAARPNGKEPFVMPPPPPDPIISQPPQPAVQQSAPQGGIAPAANPQSNAPSQPPRTGAAPAGGSVTLSFDDADVYSVIQTIFGDVLQVNYIVDPRVKGRVTFRSVAPVPRANVMQLMEVILRLNGIGIVEEGGLHRIIPITDIAKEPAPVSIGRDPKKISSTGKSILQVVPILYVVSAEVIRMITPFLSTNALVVDVPKSNQIIVVDTDANVKRLLQLLEVFDNEGVKQKKPQIFVYHCQNSKAKDVATTLQQVFLNSKGGSTGSTTTNPASPPAGKLGALPQSAPSSAPVNPPQSNQAASSASGSSEQLVSDITRIFPDEIVNAVITLATPEDYELIKQTLLRVDIAQRQVVIEGIIAEVTLTDNLSLGISGLIKASHDNFNMDIGINASKLADATATSGTGFSFVGTDSSGTVRAYITALASDSKAKVLASPHILVSDNREAKIQIGQQVPITTSETFGSTTTTPVRTVEYKDIGVILKVKPRVNEGGLVALEVNQEVSTYSKITLGNVGETQLVINKTEAATNLVVQNGQTILIGGLIREDTSKTRSGIPFLSKIPLVGWLFGDTDNTKSRTELIILLTPHVMADQAQAKKVTTGFVEGMAESSQGRIQKDELIKKEKR